MRCPQCNRPNPKQASFCMHCGAQIQTPPELQRLAAATAVLRQAESAYWAAMHQAHAAGHSLRVLDEYSAHSYAHLSRMAKRGKF